MDVVWSDENTLVGIKETKKKCHQPSTWEKASVGVKEEVHVTLNDDDGDC